MRNVNVNSPELCGIVFRLTPPMSSEFQVFSGGPAVGRGASAIGATVAEGWLGAELDDTGELSEAVVGAGVLDAVEVPPSFDAASGTSVPLFGFTWFGFVMRIADLVTEREAIALARALWCGERDDLIISHFRSCCCQ